MNYWYYLDSPVLSTTQMPESTIGFVYKITRYENSNTVSFYIGRKNIYSNRKKNLTKKELSTDKRKKTYKVVTKESDWQNYWSSCDQLKVDVQVFGEHSFKREILDYACTPKMLTYLEEKWLYVTNALEIPSYNDNIRGTMFRKDIIKCK